VSIAYPKPDRSTIKPNGSKTAGDGQIDIGWNEGVLSDGRPYRAELWAYDQLTSLTVFFSTVGLEQLTNEAARELLEREKLIRPEPNASYRSAYARPYVDSAGNAMWSVNTVLADEELVHADAPGPFLPYGTTKSGPTFVDIERDTTLRWSFRDGDYLVWITVPLLTNEPSPSIVDLWELRDGQHAIITNRYQDVPEWLELTPGEVANGAAIWMARRVNAGYQVPEQPADASNIWRVMAGDWLVWVGAPRNAQPDLRGGAMAALAKECLLVIGEGGLSLEAPIFGAPQRDGFPPEQLAAVRGVVAEIRRRGFPRESATEWYIG